MSELRIYQRTPEEDALFMTWWQRLWRDGELDQTLGVGARSLSRFFELLQAPRVATYAHDDDGIWFFGLLSPIMSGAFFSLWVAPTRRRSAKSSLATLESFFETALADLPVIVGLTRQPRLLRAHQRWGYRVVGEVPSIFDGADAWIVTLTAADYYAAKRRRHRWQPAGLGEMPHGIARESGHARAADPADERREQPAAAERPGAP